MAYAKLRAVVNPMINVQVIKSAAVVNVRRPLGVALTRTVSPANVASRQSASTRNALTIAIALMALCVPMRVGVVS